MPGNTFTEKAITFGPDVFVNYGCYFDAAARITLGAGVRVGMHSRFLTSSHEIGASHLRGARNTSAPITVGDGTWIGAAVTILPGVVIGRGCVIAAGSVVTSDCPPNGLYGGVPSRLIKTLEG